MNQAATDVEPIEGANGIGDVLNHLEDQPTAITNSRPSPEAEARSEFREMETDQLDSFYNGEGEATESETGKKGRATSTIAETLESIAEEEAADVERQPVPQVDLREEKQPVPPAVDPDDVSGLWSNQDVELISVIQSEGQRFQSDLEALARVKVLAEQLAKSDPEQAEALAPKIQVAEQELKVRRQSLQKGVQYFHSRLQQQSNAKAHANLLTQDQKLKEAMPDLDRAALAKYLGKQGYSNEDIYATSDPVLLTMAEKARRYDEQQQLRKMKIPLRKGAGQKAGKKPRLVAESGNLLKDIQRQHYDPRRDGPASASRTANGFQKRAALDSMYPNQQASPTLLMPKQSPIERLQLLYTGR